MHFRPLSDRAVEVMEEMGRQSMARIWRSYYRKDVWLSVGGMRQKTTIDWKTLSKTIWLSIAFRDNTIFTLNSL